MDSNTLDRFIGRASTVGLLSLVSCAFFEKPVTDDWYKAREAVPLTSWTKVKNVKKVCRESVDWQGVACAQVNILKYRCDVYSSISEADAKRTWWHDGMLVFDHEVGSEELKKGHCAGFDHKGSKVRGLTLGQGCVQNCGTVYQ